MSETCHICHLTYVPKIDTRRHRRHHERWLEAVSVLEYAPAPYDECESQKNVGHSKLRQGTTLNERVEGAEIVLRAWFDRSLMAAINGKYWRQHPTFAAYIQMMVLEAKDWETAIILELRHRYGSHVKDEIPKGTSYWYPPKSKARKDQLAACLRGERHRARTLRVV